MFGLFAVYTLGIPMGEKKVINSNGWTFNEC